MCVQVVERKRFSSRLVVLEILFFRACCTVGEQGLSKGERGKLAQAKGKARFILFDCGETAGTFRGVARTLRESVYR